MRSFDVFLPHPVKQTHFFPGKGIKRKRPIVFCCRLIWASWGSDIAPPLLSLYFWSLYGRYPDSGAECESDISGLKSGFESKWKGSVKAHCVVAKAQFGTVDTYSGGVEGLKADVADLHHFDALIKKKTEFRWDRLQSHIWIYEEGLPNVWGNAQMFNHKWGGPETYNDFATDPICIYFYIRNIWYSFLSAWGFGFK